MEALPLCGESVGKSGIMALTKRHSLAATGLRECT